MCHSAGPVARGGVPALARVTACGVRGGDGQVATAWQAPQLSDRASLLGEEIGDEKERERERKERTVLSLSLSQRGGPFPICTSRYLTGIYMVYIYI